MLDILLSIIMSGRPRQSAIYHPLSHILINFITGFLRSFYRFLHYLQPGVSLFILALFA